MRSIALFAAACLLNATRASAQDAEEFEVDVELILAVDVSWSMDYREQALQREGYVNAFRSEDVQRAIMGGGWGRVAVVFVEWAGLGAQSVVVPWTLIDSKESADAFAYRLGSEEPSRQRRTSIADALDRVVPMFDGNGYSGLRQVIDVSGDGPNNQGRPVTQARDAAASRGITVNGLPLMTTGGDSFGGSWGSIANLDAYYEECVIGGPGAFMIPVNGWEQFPDAVRRKLVLELAGGWMRPADADDGEVIRVQSAGTVDCLIGERLWRQRQERWNFNAP